MNAYETIRKEAVEQMSALCENPIEDTWRGMTDAKAYIYKHGNCNDKAKADAIFAQWAWSACEMRGHEMKEAMEKGGQK